MRVIKKVLSRIHKKFIFLWDGINNEKFTGKYVKFLSKRGVNFNGKPNYICSSAYIDGTGYSLITVGDKSIISKDVVLLTHDFSIRTGLMSLGREFDEVKNAHIEKEIVIGNNVFVGARAMLLPGTTIGDNVIIGAGSVVKGNIPADSVVIGNPAKIVCSLSEWAERHKDDLFVDKKIF